MSTSPEARREKWRTVAGFSLVLAINPLLPLPLLALGLGDIFNEVILGQPGCVYDKNIAASAQINTLHCAVTQYRTLNRGLPTNEQGLQVLVEPPQEARIQRKLAESAAILDPWSRPYRYRKNESPSGRNFEIWSAGEDGLDGTADDVSDNNVTLHSSKL